MNACSNDNARMMVCPRYQAQKEECRQAKSIPKVLILCPMSPTRPSCRRRCRHQGFALFGLQYAAGRALGVDPMQTFIPLTLGKLENLWRRSSSRPTCGSLPAPPAAPLAAPLPPTAIREASGGIEIPNGPVPCLPVPAHLLDHRSCHCPSLSLRAPVSTVCISCVHLLYTFCTPCVHLVPILCAFAVRGAGDEDSFAGADDGTHEGVDGHGGDGDGNGNVG